MRPGNSKKNLSSNFAIQSTLHESHDSHHDRFDAVIVGAGLAGLQCSLELLSRGWRVLLVDRKESPDQFVHTTGIFVRRTLEDFDLPPDLLGPVVRHVTLYSPARRALRLESPHEEFRVGSMGPIYQRMLKAGLGMGLEWLPSTHFVRSEATDSGSIVHLETNRRPLRARTRFLIGADGVNSKVAADLGLSRNSSWIVGAERIYTGVPLEGPPRFDCFLDPRLAPGYIAWLIHDGREVHLGVGGYSSKFRPADALKAFSDSVTGLLDFSNARLEETRGGRIPVGGVLRLIACPRGLLIGDAAGAVSPLTAGGLDGAMRLSRFAAQTLEDVASGTGRSIEMVYSGEAFRARFLSRLWMRRAIALTSSPILIELGCAVARTPVLRPVVWQLFFGRGSFPDTPAPRHSWTAQRT